jgi:hypothetical protein
VLAAGALSAAGLKARRVVAATNAPRVNSFFMFLNLNGTKIMLQHQSLNIDFEKIS